MTKKDVNTPEKDHLTQAKNLKACVINTLHNENIALTLGTADISLVRDYIDEYLSIVDSALNTWTMNKSLMALHVRGLDYRLKMSVSIFKNESQLKWVLKEIERLIIILQNID